MNLVEIYTYPIKSLGGISQVKAKVKERGLEHDRRWMLIDNNGKCITQREVPVMADLACSVESDMLKITSKSKPKLKYLVPFEDGIASLRIKVQVWDSTFDVAHIDKQHDDFFSEAIGKSCRLVVIDSKSKRNANRLRSGQLTGVSLADAYPYLIISQASLEDLNRRLKHPVDMKRFRPNLVIDGCEAYEEDTMQDIRIGNIRFRIVKSCARCVLTTIDPDTYHKGKEPLATLATYRTMENQVMFGVNAIALDYGEINVGDSVEKL
jgi:uncharacterized protein YcbX